MNELDSSKRLQELLVDYSHGNIKSIDVVARVIKSFITIKAQEVLTPEEVVEIQTLIEELFNQHYQNGTTGVDVSMVKKLLHACCTNEVARFKYDYKQSKLN